MPFKNKCEWCGNEFVRKAVQRFCSYACRGASAVRPLLDRFNEKFRKGPEDMCWPWIGAIGKNGYGVIGKDGKLESAHRVAWELAHGPIPVGMCVLHHCDTPACVNWVRHLFTGTHRDNMRDCMDKKRHRNTKENK